MGKSCTTFVIVKIVRNLSRGRSPCQRVNHVKSDVIYFSAFIYSCIRYYSYVEPGPNTINVHFLHVFSHYAHLSLPFLPFSLSLNPKNPFFSLDLHLWAAKLQFLTSTIRFSTARASILGFLVVATIFLLFDKFPYLIFIFFISFLFLLEQCLEFFALGSISFC